MYYNFELLLTQFLYVIVWLFLSSFIGAVMGLFGGKLAEIFCRACESRKTQAGKVGHEGMFMCISCNFSPLPFYKIEENVLL